MGIFFSVCFNSRKMRDELRAIVTKRLGALRTLNSDDQLVFEWQQLMDRLPNLVLRAEMCVDSRGALDAKDIRYRIDVLLSSDEGVVVYLKGALGADVCDVDSIARALHAAASSAVPLARDPPWERKIEKIGANEIAILNATSESVSTDVIHGKLKQRFEAIVSMGFPRPKVWILPTRNKMRVIVAIGVPEVVDLLLSEIHPS
jgi:hypothetical protein